jgi:hypothetical protein
MGTRGPSRRSRQRIDRSRRTDASIGADVSSGRAQHRVDRRECSDRSARTPAPVRARHREERADGLSDPGDAHVDSPGRQSRSSERLRRLIFERKRAVGMTFQGVIIDCGYRVDVLVEGRSAPSTSLIFPIFLSPFLSPAPGRVVKVGPLRTAARGGQTLTGSAPSNAAVEASIPLEDDWTETGIRPPSGKRALSVGPD